MDALDRLLVENGNERNCYLASFGEWSEEIGGVRSEEEFTNVFTHTFRELVNELGTPEYHGQGERHGVNIPRPISYFDTTESALQIAWWRAYGGEVVLFHTGHDADTLQYIVLAISDTCTSKVD